jgi:hypothetical protein
MVMCAWELVLLASRSNERSGGTVVRVAVWHCIACNWSYWVCRELDWKAGWSCESSIGNRWDVVVQQIRLHQPLFPMATKSMSDQRGGSNHVRCVGEARECLGVEDGTCNDRMWWVAVRFVLFILVHSCPFLSVLVRSCLGYVTLFVISLDR